MMSKAPSTSKTVPIRCEHLEKDKRALTDYPHFDYAGSNEVFFHWKKRNKENTMNEPLPWQQLDWKWRPLSKDIKEGDLLNRTLILK